MKKLMLVAAMVLGFAGASFAQGTVNVSASLIQGLSITPNATLAFGQVVVGTGGTNTIAAASGAQFVIQGAGTHPILITPTEGTLTIASGTITTAPLIAYTYAYSNSSAASEGADSPLSSLATASLTLGGTGLYAPGSGYLGIGGTVNATNIATTVGSYTQTITLTVTYN